MPTPPPGPQLPGDMEGDTADASVEADVLCGGERFGARAWFVRLVRALASAPAPCLANGKVDCGLCPGPRTEAELASCDRGGS